MNTNKAKSIITNWLLYEKNYLGAVTEFGIGFYRADIIGVKRSLYVAEFELKTNKSDLLRELRIIERITKGIKRKIYSISKLYKHRRYLNIIIGSKLDFIPNEFSFIVTEGLEDILIDYIKDTMYGAYFIKKEYGNYPIAEIKRPKKFHKKKIDDVDIKRLFGKVSIENNDLRKKLYFNN
ncbi:unnamed protein product [marine sediment metagenome]|uniref:Uncharacterized protein n=1 Tax=marine sediment metagenome TaxID=412755 RepID=X1FGC3_9ZZZZ